MPGSKLSWLQLDLDHGGGYERRRTRDDFNKQVLYAYVDSLDFGGH